MVRLCAKVPQMIFMGIYIYLALPVVIFLLGWLKLPIGIPAAELVAAGAFLCYREHDFNAAGHVEFSGQDLLKCIAAIAIVVIWVFFSGVGKYVWQNSDHYVRNEIFNVMTEKSWPVYSDTPEGVPLVYYIGFWLPSAVIGKVFGLQAGYFAQAVWAVIGILLCFALICIKRNKISIWPLLVFMGFSGLDAIGSILMHKDTFQIFGTLHLEWWHAQYQFSSMTTQLFWVFNQALPAWLVCMLVFLFEKPKNMLFTWSTLLLVSSFPFVGLIPFVVYFMIKRSGWQESYRHVHNLVGDMWRNLASVQNFLSALVIILFCGVYLIGNASLSGTVALFFSDEGTFRGYVFVIAIGAAVIFFLAVSTLIIKGYKKIVCASAIVLLMAFCLYMLYSRRSAGWQSVLWGWGDLTLFYFLEAGIFLLVLYRVVQDKFLFWLNAICLYLIPLIRVGYSNDFCMRASIPGVLLIVIWCVDAFDGAKAAGRKSKVMAGLLALLLIVGAVTPFHEVLRTYVNTREGQESYTISEEELFQGTNFYGLPNGFFWRYLAK